MAARQRDREDGRGAAGRRYEHGFVTDIEQEFAPRGLTDDTVRFISAKKNEPQWMLDWRLEAFQRWLAMDEPDWAKLSLSRRSTTRTPTTTPRPRPGRAQEPGRGRSRPPGHLREAGHPAARAGGAGRRRGRAEVRRRRRCSTASRVVTTFKKELAEAGVIFCSMSEADPRASGAGEEVPRLGRAGQRQLLRLPEHRRSSPTAPSSMCRRACAARWSCRPISASMRRGQRPVRAHPDHRRQGRRTSRTWRAAPRPMRDENQLHAAVVELVAAGRRRDQVLHRPELVPGRPGDRQGRHLQLRHQARRLPRRPRQGRPGPRSRPARPSPGSIRPASCAATGSLGRVLLDRHHQRPPAGRHRHQDDPPGRQHAARGSSPRASAAGKSSNTYRGLVSAHPKAKGARNFTQCDSLLIGKDCAAHTVPYIEARNGHADLRARGDHHAPVRRPAVLCHAARPRPGRGRAAAGQRLRQGRAAGAARWSSPSRPRSWWRSSLEGSVG